MTERDFLIGGLTDALRKAKNLNPTPEQILVIIAGDNCLSNLWERVYGLTSPTAIAPRVINHLITNLVRILNPKVETQDELIDSRTKVNAEKNVKLRSMNRWKDREWLLLWRNTLNPREYGNG